jgi:hypothetical protein
VESQDVAKYVSACIISVGIYDHAARDYIDLIFLRFQAASNLNTTEYINEYIYLKISALGV